MAERLNPQDTEDLLNARAETGAIDEQATSWSNILSLKLQANKAAKEELEIREKIAKLGREEAKKAIEYKQTTQAIETYQKELIKHRQDGNRKAAGQVQKDLVSEQKKQAELKKTAGGALMAISLEARNKKIALSAERALIKDINKERGLGSKITDLFRTKKEKQRSVDIARAAVGGGSNKGPGTSSKKGLGESIKESRVGGALIAALEKLKGPFNEIKRQATAAIVAPFADAASLLTGESFGMGGGKANAAGATSILGGMKDLVSTIPFVGGLLGGLLGVFKGLLDAVLGIDEANFRVGRSMNISAEAAGDLRTQFDKVANTSGNLVVNSTRLLQSYVEIGSQLGINKELSSDIYENDVKLRDILGLEAQSRKVISDQAIVTGRNAKELTQSAIGTVASFNKLVGTSFKWSDILSEASKLGGLLGLTLTKFPEKIYNAVTATKALGFDLKQLDATANSFLDFEGSISKEMEAQVLTGKDLNLTRAREAALNNDNATLAEEITKNVGSTAEFLNMNRIQQEGIAAAVGMTRDGLADVLKNQEIYARASVTDQKGLVAKLELLKKQKATQEDISAALGKDGYALATQVSTAESLTEVMERIKIAVVSFVKDTGLFDFIAKPEKINGFITGLTERLGGFIRWIGNAIATLLEGLGSFVHIFSSETGDQLMTIAAQARAGSAELGNSIQAIGAKLNATTSNSINGSKEAGASKKELGSSLQDMGAKLSATASSPMSAVNETAPSKKELVYTIQDAGAKTKNTAFNSINEAKEVGIQKRETERGVQAIGANLGGLLPSSISETKEAGIQKEMAKAPTIVMPQQAQYASAPQNFTANLILDGQQITSTVFRNANQTTGLNYT